MSEYQTISNLKQVMLYSFTLQSIIFQGFVLTDFTFPVRFFFVFRIHFFGKQKHLKG